MSTRRLTGKHRLLTSLAVLALCACGAEADRTTPDETTATTTVALDDPDGLITPDFASSYLPPNVVDLGKLFGELSGYYSAAKSAIEIGTKFAQMLGILDKPDPNAPFNALRDSIQTTLIAADWHSIMLFIDDQRGPAVWAMQRVARAGGSVVEGGNEDLASGGAVSAITGPSDSAFMRPWVESNGTDFVTRGGWTRTITSRPTKTSSGLVYDWRVGVPAMLELITIRLMVIGGMDPNFRWNDRYDGELRSIRDAVKRHYDKMLSGVKCAEYWAQPDGATRVLGHEQVCADIHTGIYAHDSYSWNWINARGGPPNQTQGAIIQQRLRSQVLRAMPLFEMKQMIDTLTLYINGTQDLTETNQEIRLAAGGNNFCIDIPWGDGSPLVPLQIYGCHGAAPQAWVYDRPSGQIRNPLVGTCLDVWPTVEQLPEQLFAINGIANNATVYSNTCDGSAAQRWTYDPDTQQLQNAFGMFLFSNSWSPQDHDALMAYQVDKDGKALATDGRAIGQPKWQAVQKTIGKRSALLWRHADGQLVVWDTLAGGRYSETSLGWVDNVWRPVATGDFNADGHGDILWRDLQDGFLSIWQLNNTTPVSFPSPTGNAPTSKLPTFSGDLDGDHVTDLLWTSTAGDPRLKPTYVSTAWYMNPSSSEPRATQVWSSTTLRTVGVGNFDGDTAGTADQVSLAPSGMVVVELSNGTGWTSWVDPKVWVVRGVGDFNGDGTSDVLWYNTNDGRVARGIMYGGRQQPLAVSGTVPPLDGWSIQAAADVDHDGISDIVWRHVDGWVSYWMMNAGGSVRDNPTLWLDPTVTFAGVIELGPPR